MIERSKRWLGIAVFVGLLLILGSPLAPERVTRCENSPDKKQMCTKYSVTYYFLWQGIDALDHYNGAIIAVFTIVLALYTVRLAAATDKLVAGADETAKRQLRAYVLVQSARINHVETGKNPVVTVTLKNFGQTPAHDLEQWCTNRWDVFPPTIRFPDPGFNEQVAKAPVGPRGFFIVISPFELPVPSQAINEMRSGSHAIYVIGAIRYRDIFGDIQTTSFRMFCGGPLKRVDHLSPTAAGNEAS